MILASACLVGIHCRYNGSGKPHARLIHMMEAGEVLPACPEQLGGLPTPRPPAEIRMLENGEKRVFNNEGQDVTDAFLEGARKTLALCGAVGITQAVLQPRSPSCGCGCVYDGTFRGILRPGDGFTARLLLDNGVEVVSVDEWEKTHGDA